MKSRMFLCLAGAITCCAGCGGPLTLTARTLVIQPSEYCRSLSSFVEHRRDRALAEAAWQDVVHAQAEHTYSADYASGFIDGFEDYLYAGGNGEPPPLPPRSYWKPRYETPEGREAVQDWFAGFRHGADEARRSGYRQLVIAPASSPPLSAVQRFNPVISGPPRDFTGPMISPALEVLPADSAAPPAPSEPIPVRPRKASPYHEVPAGESPEGGARDVDRVPGDGK